MVYNIEEKLKTLPAKPGVYLMKDHRGRVIYVGKAVSLRNRVRSYFRSPSTLSARTRALREHIDSLDFIVTDTEVEALILESNLIKQHKPKYNVRIKDDKHYPYLKVCVNEHFPRMLVARRIKNDGARYFGPYPDAGKVRETIKLLRKLFPIRSCKKNLQGDKVGRPCLNYHIGRCPAPCLGNVSREEYMRNIERICMFLEGKEGQLIERLGQEMNRAAAELNFERAAVLRDQLDSVKEIIEKQKIISAGQEDRDIIGIARDDKEAYVQVFYVRNGKLLGRDSFALAGTEDAGTSTILAGFVKQFYIDAIFIPREILLPVELEEHSVIEQWLTTKRGKRTYLKVPIRGEKHALVEMATKNAELARESDCREKEQKQEQTKQALAGLQKYLDLPRLPKRIEAYDISNIQGKYAVGSMVVFTDGLPDNKEYRRFRIKGPNTPDDYRMMQEVLWRRFKRAESGDAKFGRLPDLVLIDGGKGQLKAAVEVLTHLEQRTIPAIGLAKREEEVFVPGKSDPVAIVEGSPAHNLLRHIRDEAHRFAITYHRNVRDRSSLTSVLDNIPGIGPERRRALLQEFGGLAGLKRASRKDLAKVGGIGEHLADIIYESIRSYE